MKIGDKVKVIKDNHAESHFESLAAYRIEMGDIGVISEVSDFYCDENIIVQFPDSILCCAENELEIVKE